MQTLLIEVFGPLAVAFVLYVLVIGVRHLLHQVRNRITPEQHRAARDSFRSRLVHPQPREVEQGIGALLPQRLLTLYEDHQTILSEQLEIRRPHDGDASTEWIEAFLPLDLESQKYSVDLTRHGWGKGFCFATDGSGNFYWTPANAVRQADAPVFYASRVKDDHPFEKTDIAASLNEFLSWPRTSYGPES